MKLQLPHWAMIGCTFVAGGLLAIEGPLPQYASAIHVVLAILASLGTMLGLASGSAIEGKP